eukprot:5878928-Pyramimonas_sp.AAC.1
MGPPAPSIDSSIGGYPGVVALRAPSPSSAQALTNRETNGYYEKAKRHIYDSGPLRGGTGGGARALESGPPQQ